MDKDVYFSENKRKKKRAITTYFLTEDKFCCNIVCVACNSWQFNVMPFNKSTIAITT